MEAVYGPEGKVERFAADFEQHCEGRAPALRGSIRYNATAPSPGDDMVVWRPGNGTWYLRTSSSGFTTVQIRRGGQTGDIPWPAPTSTADRSTLRTVRRFATATGSAHMTGQGVSKDTRGRPVD